MSIFCFCLCDFLSKKNHLIEKKWTIFAIITECYETHNKVTQQFKAIYYLMKLYECTVIFVCVLKVIKNLSL